MTFSNTKLSYNMMTKSLFGIVGGCIQAFTLLALTLTLFSCSNTQDAEPIRYDQQANVAINGGELLLSRPCH
jgi:hypothetical protein